MGKWWSKKGFLGIWWGYFWALEVLSRDYLAY